MSLFIEVILPIMAVFASGFILQRIRLLDVKSVSAVSLYILTPALVFVTLYDATFDSGFLIILIYMFVLFFIMVFINKLLAKIFGWNSNKESAAILATGFMNSGNYGLPVVLYSIGPAAVPYAIFIMVVQALQNNFFGVYYASRSTSGMKKAVKNVLKMPTTYAAVFAFVCSWVSITIPDFIHSTLTMVGDAAIPVMMIMLGMQLGSLIGLKLDWQVVLSSVSLKMIIAPLIAWLFVIIIDVDPLIASVLIIISAMPTAATTTMYAIEFDTEPELVSSITFISTIVSVITLTILLNIIT
ncbi:MULTISPECIES: AEC family transporter [Oceanobacillus]|uniref:AEC family transporter n=1 Tax=Oceanobacillus TaxID=182709 RepID=UPI00034D84AD|nr:MULTISPECIES: AEC family transporter [Oceanobacillus]MBT2600210.1 AEC family transporter [Oceanobacillus sp. ISL-74]MBT2650368.1 AEC family transporter [Oceanobacillus sp. ISL-73]MCT1578111.1 AEC family transporter [Oceanobacillus kimchii]MCT2134289.1 AEC family transporter [Oceanobacillus kimchii]OEH55079.1 transporter [Oceanobacillus sp. E9]